WLEDALKHRRDELPRAAHDFYGLLTEEVDVHATDVPDSADVHYEPSGSVYLTIQPRSAHGESPWFARRFYPNETHDVRLYLHGGEDVAYTHGQREKIRVRVIGGEIDKLSDSARIFSILYPDRTEHLADEHGKNEHGKKEKKVERSDPESGPYAPEAIASE